MGQKITEYPQVDQWVRLMREADKAGADTHRWRRPATDDREWDRYQQMEVARKRIVAGYKSADEWAQFVEGPHYLTECQRCATPIHDVSGAFLKRTVFPTGGGRIDLYLCAECSGR